MAGREWDEGFAFGMNKPIGKCCFVMVSDADAAHSVAMHSTGNQTAFVSGSWFPHSPACHPFFGNASLFGVSS